MPIRLKRILSINAPADVPEGAAEEERHCLLTEEAKDASGGYEC